MAQSLVLEPTDLGPTSSSCSLLALEIPTFATDEFEYTFQERATAIKSFNAYLHALHLSAEALVELLYA